MSETEYKLCNWREGNPKAERLAGAILHLEGYSSVDPQCPLGGPDGTKDLLCEKNGWLYIGAAYFPTTIKTYEDVQSKFEGDLEGVKKNGATGIVFLTNQKLTPGERNKLEEIGKSQGTNVILYHVERVLGILNSPVGYGVRLEYLGIPMTIEEQLSFFSRWDTTLSDKLHENSLFVIRELSKKLDALYSPITELRGDIGNISAIANRTTAAINQLVRESDKSKVPASTPSRSTAFLSVAILCSWHRAVLLDEPVGISRNAGILRTREVWIGKAGASREDAIHVPPSPEEIPEKLEALCTNWNEKYLELESQEVSKKVAALTEFHHKFLYIHPFLDGNGRLARFILGQQAFELLDVKRNIVLEDRRPYLDALHQADSGDLSRLEKEITQALFGVEFIEGSPCQMSGQECPSCRRGVIDISGRQDGVECSSCGAYYPASNKDG